MTLRSKKPSPCSPSGNDQREATPSYRLDSSEIFFDKSIIDSPVLSVNTALNSSNPFSNLYSNTYLFVLYKPINPEHGSMDTDAFEIDFNFFNLSSVISKSAST